MTSTKPTKYASRRIHRFFRMIYGYLLRLESNVLIWVGRALCFSATRLRKAETAQESRKSFWVEVGFICLLQWVFVVRRLPSLRDVVGRVLVTSLIVGIARLVKSRVVTRRIVGHISLALLSGFFGIGCFLDANQIFGTPIQSVMRGLLGVATALACWLVFKYLA